MSPRQSAAWFGQLAALTRAGIPIPEAVRRASGPPAPARESLAAALESGTDPRAAWPTCGFLDDSDALVAAAGQHSGRFPELCLELSLRHDAAAALRSKLFTAALYPVFLINFALFVGPFIITPDMSGNTRTSLDTILSRGVVYGAVNVILFWVVVLGALAVFNRNPALRARLLRVLPLWAGVARHTAYAVFAGTLASLLRAGTGIGEAWRFAGRASGDPGIGALAERVAGTVDRDRSPPGALVAASDVFPENFRALYLAGEQSGSLEQRLDELRARHADEAATRATVAAFAYTKLLLLVVMLLVAVRIVTFYAGMYSRSAIDSMMKM